MANEVLLDVDRLRRFCTEVFVKVGLQRDDAFIVADSLVFANLRGIDSHGILRLPHYARRLALGGSKANPNIAILKEKPACALIYGDNGMGQVIGHHAVKMAIQKAKTVGVGFIGVKGSAHYGAASYYTNMIAQEKMIGFTTTNTTQIMAAWGGAKKVMGNNPISIAIPYKEKTLALDISMSRVSGGKIKLYAKENKKIPKGWGLDKAGCDTDDPNDVITGGAYLPFGEYKGYGLAVMMEVLAGVLTGANMLSQNRSWWKYPESPLNLGQCFGAIDIDCFVGIEEFEARLEAMIEEIKASPLAEGSKGIYMPGELELAVEEERRQGIPVSESIWKDLLDVAQDYGVSADELILKQERN